MKRTIFILVAVMAIMWTSRSYAGVPYQHLGIDVGNTFAAKRVFVSTTPVILISTDAGFGGYNDESWILKNVGPYAVLIDSSSSALTNTFVSTTTNMGYLFEYGDDPIFLNGRLAANIFIRALEQKTTIYYMKVKSR